MHVSRITNTLAKKSCTRTIGTCCMSSGADEKLEKTALYDFHVSNNGKMVPFAGYALPVQYTEGIIQSHLHTRSPNCASYFDVGHMGQLKWYGKDRQKFMETLCVADVKDLPDSKATLSVLTTENGGIIDDCIISNHGDYNYMVVNGATKYGDMKHFDEKIAEFRAKGGDVTYEYLHDQNLIALQGPGSSEILASLTEPAYVDMIKTMPFMSGRANIPVAGVECIVTRCGYTGEDGYEISMRPEHAVTVATAIHSAKNVLPSGLAARDSLRLEAGLCLYGNDIDTTTTPIEAGLAWTIPKSRREGDRANFPGAKLILDELRNKSWNKRRVGISVDKVPARAGTKVFKFDENIKSVDEAEQIGTITSGTYSPCLKAPVAMGYVKPAYVAEGTPLYVESRGKLVKAVVSKMPFVPSNYYRG